jgi:hypothetical protein
LELCAEFRVGFITGRGFADWSHDSNPSLSGGYLGKLCPIAPLQTIGSKVGCSGAESLECFSGISLIIVD